MKKYNIGSECPNCKTMYTTLREAQTALKSKFECNDCQPLKERICDLEAALVGIMNLEGVSAMSGANDMLEWLERKCMEALS